MTITTLILFILSNALAKGKTIAIQYSRSTQITYLFSMTLTYVCIDWYFFEQSRSVFNSLIYFSLSNLIFIFFIFLLVFIILLLTAYYPAYNIARANPSISLKSFGAYLSLKDLLQINRDHYKILEYPLIIQFIIIGSITLLSCNDLISIFLCIELQSYGLYIISTIYRNSELSTGAGLTYFLLGGLSSCVILLGLSFIYINSGVTSLDGVYLIHNITTSDINLVNYFIGLHEKVINAVFYYVPIYTLTANLYEIQLSFIVLVTGFLFKVAAAPFHSWSPSVYDAIPTVTTTFVAIVPKIAILLLFFDLVYYTWYTTFEYSWTNVLLFSSFLSLIIGSILGLTQFRIKRLYAYSTISHVGFILLALCVHNVESIQAFFFYIIQYSLSNLNAFIILILIGYSQVFYKKKTIAYERGEELYRRYEKKISSLSPVEYITQLKGYFYLNPILSLSFAITLYSFIGIPPLVGFFAKQMVLSSALDNGKIFMCLIAILTSVISAVYYLYIVKHLFFDKTNLTQDDYLSLPIEKKDVAIYPFFRKKDEKENVINPLTKTIKDTIITSNLLVFTVSTLTWVSTLFIFLYSEIYLLMNILSILFVY